MDDLVNPNADRSPKFKWEDRYQQEILGMLLNDKMFLVQTMGLVKPQYFINSSHEVICSCLFNYFKEFCELPSGFVFNELIRDKIEDSALRIKTISDYQYCVNSFLPGSSSRDFNTKRITQFAKEQALREAISKSIELMHKRDDADRWAKIEEAMRQALSVDISYDIGLDYMETIDERYARAREQVKNCEVFVTGFEDIDSKISHGGLKKGEIAAFLGRSGVGKSNFLCKAAVENLKRNKKVLYITLELSQDKVATRIDSILCRIDMKNIPDAPDDAVIFPEHIGKKTEEIVKTYINDNFPGASGSLIIKQFPAGTLSVNSLRGYLSQVMFRGHKPDMLVLDYVGEMKDHEGIKTYESRQMIVRDLRAVAVQENICVFTALQASNKSDPNTKESRVDESAIADSFGQVRPLDALWAINQAEGDQDYGVGSLYIDKHRDGESKVMTFFKKDMLDARSISKEAYYNIRSAGNSKKAETVDLPKFEPKNKKVVTEEWQHQSISHFSKIRPICQNQPNHRRRLEKSPK